MKPDNRHLIDDLLHDAEEDTRRELILLAGGRILRRRRIVRAMMPVLTLILIIAVVAFWLHDNTTRQQTKITSQPKPPAPVRARALSDDELLALFPDTPVALATLPDGKKRLIFPRHGDEQRFITRL